MSVPLDTTVYPILELSAGAEDVRTLGVEFGDGYGQSVVDGINAEEEVWQVVFRAFEPVKFRTLKTIFKQGNDNLLECTLPGDDTAKYWEAGKFQYKPVMGKIQLSCEFNRKYPLVV